MAKAIAPRYIIRDREQSAVAEAFRALVASIQETRQTSGQLQTVLFTGATPGEGIALTALNTAACLAYSGKRVVLVDCDLRSPKIHQILGLRNEGVTSIVHHGGDLADLIQDSAVENLKVLAGGPAPRRPIETLSDPVIRESLAVLQANADYVILTSSPLIFKDNDVISDACVLAAKVDGVVLVLDSREVRVQAAQKAVELLNGAKARIIGTVLNDVYSDRDLIYHTASQ